MTGWQAPARSAGAARVYAAAEEQRLADPDAFRLDADAVAERAARELRRYLELAPDAPDRSQVEAMLSDLSTPP